MCVLLHTFLKSDIKRADYVVKNLETRTKLFKRNRKTRARNVLEDRVLILFILPSRKRRLHISLLAHWIVNTTSHYTPNMRNVSWLMSKVTSCFE